MTGASDIGVFDNFLDPEQQKQIYQYLLGGPGWSYGARSHMVGMPGSLYLSKHFAGCKGAQKAEIPAAEHEQAEQELKSFPIIAAMWQKVRGNSKLIRCYANGYPNGAEGSLHADATNPKHYTLLYYPHLKWDPDWGGETMFFKQELDDLLCAVYPKPNRLVKFPGTIPHVARGVPPFYQMLRITLMFKVSI